MQQPRNYFLYRFIKVTALPSAFYFAPKVVYTGSRLPKGGFLMVSNHPTMVDPITLLFGFYFHQLHFVASKDLFRTKLGAWFFNQCHVVDLDKQNFSMNTFHEVGDLLKRGKPVVIFPEGGVSTEEEKGVRAFKSGAVMMALRNKVPVVPVYIDVAKRRPVLVVGEPIRVDNGAEKPTMKDIAKATEALFQAEVELKEKWEGERK